MNRDVLLYSGGLDSYIAYYYLNEPFSIFCNMKHKYADIEENRVRKMIDELGMNISIDNYSFDFSRMEQDDAIIPNRNIYLSMLATNFGDSIWMAACNGDYNKDKNPEIFVEASNFLSKLTQRNITLKTPFWEMTKTDMIRWYLQSRHNEEGLHYTYSCFNGEDEHCGMCSSCLRRWIAFVNNDIKGTFKHDPVSWDRIPEYIYRFSHDTNPIDTMGRKHEFFHALFKHGYSVPNLNVDWVEDIRAQYT